MNTLQRMALIVVATLCLLALNRLVMTAPTPALRNGDTVEGIYQALSRSEADLEASRADVESLKTKLLHTNNYRSCVEHANVPVWESAEGNAARAASSAVRARAEARIATAFASAQDAVDAAQVVAEAGGTDWVEAVIEAERAAHGAGKAAEEAADAANDAALAASQAAGASTVPSYAYDLVEAIHWCGDPANPYVNMSSSLFPSADGQ